MPLTFVATRVLLHARPMTHEVFGAVRVMRAPLGCAAILERHWRRRGVQPFQYVPLEGAAGWWCEARDEKALRRALEGSSTFVWCPDCALGYKCQGWFDADTVAKLREGGFRAPGEVVGHQGSASDDCRLLGLTEPFTKDELQRAFRRLIAQHHPDHGGDAELAKRIIAANARLSARF